MGLDVYVYKIVQDQNDIDYAMNEYRAGDSFDQLGYGVYAVSRFTQSFWGCQDNIRVNDLFERFKGHIQKNMIRDAYDYPKMESLYGKLQEFVIDYRDSLIAEYVDLVTDIRGDIDVNHPNNKDCDLFNIYKNVDDVYHIISTIDIPTIDIDDDVLLFKATKYCNKTHIDSIYSSFFGDCWYENDNSGLDDVDTRLFVYPEEMDELKTHFCNNSDVQNWILSDDEIVYLSA